MEIISGALAGEKFLIQGGRQVRVGNSPAADIAVPVDLLLSEAHFTFWWDENGCRIQDLQSARGTFLNGQKINQAAVRNGDRIVAGQTHFAVRVKRESALPASTLASPRQPAVRQSDSPTTAELLQRPTQTPEVPDLLDLLRAQPEPLFAILDAARDLKVLEILRNCDQTYQSLYEGSKGEELADFAPYLVELPARSSLIDALVQEGWGKSWGVYLTCSKMFTDIRRHLRHFLIVELEGAKGKQLYFRFYDPRVLRVFLTTCTQPEIAEFFGPISSYLMEADEPRELLKFTAARPAGIREASASAARKRFWKSGIKSLRHGAMLTIRRAQLDTFAKAAVRKFEDRMVVHLTELFQEKCERLGQSKIRDAVQHGIERAASYGLTGERTVCKYIEMMFRFGIDFDVDPEFAWVPRILRQPTCNSERTIDYVYETALQKRAQTSGARSPPRTA